MLEKNIAGIPVLCCQSVRPYPMTVEFDLTDDNKTKTSATTQEHSAKFSSRWTFLFILYHYKVFITCKEKNYTVIWYLVSLSVKTKYVTYNYRPHSEAGEGYVFTGVCHSVNSGEGTEWQLGGGVTSNASWDRSNGHTPNVTPHPHPMSPTPRRQRTRDHASYWNAYLLFIDMDLFCTENPHF